MSEPKLAKIGAAFAGAVVEAVTNMRGGKRQIGGLAVALSILMHSTPGVSARCVNANQEFGQVLGSGIQLATPAEKLAPHAPGQNTVIQFHAPKPA